MTIKKDNCDGLVVSVTMGCIGIIGITGLICSMISSQTKEVTKQEAIKAGLIQDQQGHWVKP